MELSAATFKARCLAVLDEVAESGIEVVVTKRGRPVARVVPLAGAEAPSLLGSVRYDDETALFDPVDEPWEAGR